MRSRSLAVTALPVATARLDSPRYTRARADAWLSVRIVRNGVARREAHVGFGGAF